MNDQGRITQILSRFPDQKLVISEQEGLVRITVLPENIHEVCEFLKKMLRYDYLQFLTCIDTSDKLQLQYYLYSYTHKGSLVLKTDIDRVGGTIQSVSSIWRTADWHEREAYDLFGVVFEGHPELRRILLEDDFEGYPLLKDYSNKNMIRLPNT